MKITGLPCPAVQSNSCSEGERAPAKGPRTHELFISVHPAAALQFKQLTDNRQSPGIRKRNKKSCNKTVCCWRPFSFHVITTSRHSFPHAIVMSGPKVSMVTLSKARGPYVPGRLKTRDKPMTAIGALPATRPARHLATTRGHS